MIELDTTEPVTKVLLFQKNFCHLCGEQDGDHKEDCPLLQQLAIELDTEAL